LSSLESVSGTQWNTSMWWMKRSLPGLMAASYYRRKGKNDVTLNKG